MVAKTCNFCSQDLRRFPSAKTCLPATKKVNLRLCNAATIRYSLLKLGHMYLCGNGCKYFSPHRCKCKSFVCIATIRCGNACHGPHSNSVYSGSEHHQFNSPRLVKRKPASPTHGSCWLAQTNYDALMTHHATVDSRYLAPGGSQNSRARVKWFCRYLRLSHEGHDKRLSGSQTTTLASTNLKQ